MSVLIGLIAAILRPFVRHRDPVPYQICVARTGAVMAEYAGIDAARSALYYQALAAKEPVALFDPASRLIARVAPSE